MTQIEKAYPNDAGAIRLSHDSRPRLWQADVYTYLVRECLGLCFHTLRDVERVWDLNEEEAFNLGIVSCPSEIGNLIASQNCAEKFEDLTSIPGFYSYDRTASSCLCLEWRDDCVCNLKSWRLDLDPQLSRAGLIVPAGNSLVVYRSTDDPRPFKLLTTIRRVP